MWRVWLITFISQLAHACSVVMCKARFGVVGLDGWMKGLIECRMMGGGGYWGRTLFTFPNSRVYSSRTSCSRELTSGLVVRRRGLLLLGVESGAEEGEGSWSWSWRGVWLWESGGEDILTVFISWYCILVPFSLSRVCVCWELLSWWEVRCLEYVESR